MTTVALPPNRLRAIQAARLDTLSSHQQAAMIAARSAARRAHVPYSGFHVGAALITPAGIVPGCNVENASYGLTICAERNAMFAGVAVGWIEPDDLPTFLAVTCPDGDPQGNPYSVMPCGACRQVMAELLAPGALVAVDGVGVFSVDELLPSAFTLHPTRA